MLLPELINHPHLWGPTIAGLVLTLSSIPLWIGWQQRRVLGQAIREEGPTHHQVKSGTPTAGGICILLAWLVVLFGTYLITGRPISTDIWVLVGVTITLGLLGLLDDGLKMAKRHNSGINGRTKLVVQGVLGLGLGGYVWATTGDTTTNIFGWSLTLGWVYPLFSAWVMAAFSNAVNLTDGVDGLAASTLAVSFLLLGCLLSPLGPLLGVDPMVALLPLVATGCLLGFLWFNKHPAKIFMGDTGSLALGGLLAGLGLLAKMEWWLLGFGLLFVLEALSVTLQVASVKLRQGKRLFRMSPLHHHFELGGWSENRIVRVFVLIQLIGCLIAISLLPNLYLGC